MICTDSEAIHLEFRIRPSNQHLFLPPLSQECGAAKAVLYPLDLFHAKGRLTGQIASSWLRHDLLQRTPMVEKQKRTTHEFQKSCAVATKIIVSESPHRRRLPARDCRPAPPSQHLSTSGPAPTSKKTRPDCSQLQTRTPDPGPSRFYPAGVRPHRPVETVPKPRIAAITEPTVVLSFPEMHSSSQYIFPHAIQDATNPPPK